MSFSPGRAESDYLKHIIFLPKFYYKFFFLQKCADCCLVIAISYISLFIYNSIFNREQVIEQDILVAGASFEVILCVIGINNSQIKQMNINQKHQHFWSNEFLSPLEKRKLRDSMRFPVFSEYLLWFFSVVVVIVLEFTAIEHSRFIYKQSWPDFAKRIYKSGFFLLCSCGYYVGNSHHAYYVHTILHSCYQMKLLAAYMKREMKRYRTIPLGSKIHCESYQREAREILMRSIRQYQRLKKDGNETAAAYGQITVSHTLVAIFVCSIGLHSVLFSHPPNVTFIAAIAAQLGYGAVLSFNFGHMFSEAYEGLYMELQQLEWYTLNITNQKLYYMFLMYAQKEHAIEILPSVKMSRPVVTEFLKTTYSFITVLKTLQS